MLVGILEVRLPAISLCAVTSIPEMVPLVIVKCILGQRLPSMAMIALPGNVFETPTRSG
jgi:hypothetical protein